MTQNFKTLFYDGEDKKILVFREEDRNILFMPNYIGWEESDKQLPDIIKEIFDARKPFNNLIISFLIGNSIITYSSDEYTITDLRETSGQFKVYIPVELYNGDDGIKRSLENRISKYFFKHIGYNYELRFVYEPIGERQKGICRLTLAIICGNYALWDIDNSNVFGMV